jgi:hypothetical protein
MLLVCSFKLPQFSKIQEHDRGRRAVKQPNQTKTKMDGKHKLP